MARIRTIKPEFFRHEGLFELERETGLPIRVAFAGLWTAADREGRFKWLPRQLKLDALPYDEVDFSRVLDALTTRGHIVKYAVNGVVYGAIPSWHDHQVINNRESTSELPGPEKASTESTTSTREQRVNDASGTPLVHAQGEGKGREGKGREGEGEGVAAASDGKPPDPTPTATPRGTRLPTDWHLPKSWGEWALGERSDWTAEHCRSVAASFADHWRAKPGKDATKLDWEATWRNWVRADRKPVLRAAVQPDLDQLTAGVRRNLGMTKQGSVIDV